MSKSRNMARSALIIIVLTLGSKFLGFIREVLIAAKFGSGIETDAFFVAMTGTTLITELIRNAISTTFIPVLSEVEVKEGKEGKLYHANNINSIIFLISVLLVGVGWFISPLLVKILAKGFTGEQFILAIKLTKIGLPMILFSGAIGALTAYLQSEQRFFSTSFIGFPFNFIYIFFLVFLSSRFGIEGLMVAAVIAVFSQLLILLPEAKISGFRFKYVFDIKDSYVSKVLYLSIPVLIGVAINDLNVIVDRTLASGLVTGSISALNYANKLNNLILTVFISAITTVVFPILADEFNKNNIDGVKRVMAYGVNLILIISLPATVGLVVLAKPIVEVAFERGAFDATATVMTSQALIFYSIGLVAMALRLLLTRVYYSLQDTKTPMINGAISVGINIVLNLILIKYMAHAGLAFATSIATTIAIVLMFYDLRKKIGSLGTISYIKCGIKVMLASAIMGIIAYIVYHGIYNALGVSKLYNLISLLFAVMTGVIIYSVLCYMLRIKEVRDMVLSVKSRILMK